jgi:hypothetical protein
LWADTDGTKLDTASTATIISRRFIFLDDTDEADDPVAKNATRAARIHQVATPVRGAALFFSPAGASASSSSGSISASAGSANSIVCICLGSAVVPVWYGLMV